jgi:hypothetical protein
MISVMAIDIGVTQQGVRFLFYLKPRRPQLQISSTQQFQIQQSSHRKLVFTDDRSPVGTVFD